MDTTLSILALAWVLVSPVSAQTSPERSQVRDEAPLVRVFDIADLTGHARLKERRAALSDTQKQQVLGAPSIEAQLEELAGLERRAAANATTLVSLLKAFCDPPFDPDDDLSGVDWVEGGHLIVIATPTRQAVVTSMLDRIREADKQVHVRCRLLSMPPNHVGRAGVFIHGEHRVVPAEEAAELTAALQEAGAQVVTSPELVTLVLQRSSISIFNERSFVVDYELHVVEPGARLIADPVVETKAEGVSLELVAIPVSDDRYGLELTLEQSEIDDPVSTTEVELDPSLPLVEIALPSVRSTAYQTKVALAPGAVTMVAVKTLDPERALLLMIELNELTGVK